MRKKLVSRCTALDFERIESKFLKELVSKVPWELDFEGIKVPKCWPLNKSHLLR